VSLCISAELHEFTLRSIRYPCAVAYSVSLISRLKTSCPIEARGISGRGKRVREGCSRRKEAVLRGVRSRRLGLLVSWRAEIGSEVGSYPQGRGLFLVYDLFFLVFKSLKTQL
jgi:hypothetical protein